MSPHPIDVSLRRQRNSLIKLSLQYAALFALLIGVTVATESWINPVLMAIGSVMAVIVLVLLAMSVHSQRFYRRGVTSIDRSQSRPCQLQFRQFPYLGKGGMWVVDIRLDGRRLLRPVDLMQIVPDDGAGTFIGDPDGWGAVQLSDDEAFVAPLPDAKTSAWLEKRFPGMAHQ